jgi:hypothetical protein
MFRVLLLIQVLVNGAIESFEEPVHLTYPNCSMRKYILAQEWVEKHRPEGKVQLVKCRIIEK